MRISSSLISAVAATGCDSGEFCVTSCNDVNNNNATAMTISVAQDYMEQHHAALQGTFICDGSDCTKTIQGAALSLNLADSNYIYLEHEMVTVDQTIANSAIYFAGRTTTFKCKYPRAVNVDGSFTVDPTDPDPYVGDGTFNFDMRSEVSGGRTRLTITQEHGIPSLVANVETCAITYANMPESVIYPVRNLATWGDSEVCKDSRVETTLNHANGGATIDWKTFHFNDPNTVGLSQQQVVTCEIAVSDTLSVITPPDCSCTTSEDACHRQATGVVFQHLNQLPLLQGDVSVHPWGGLIIGTDLTIPRLYELSFDVKVDTFRSNGRALIWFNNNNFYPSSDIYGSDPFINVMGSNNGGPVIFGTSTRELRESGFNGSRTKNIPQADVLGQWLSFTIGYREVNGVVEFYQTIDGPDGNLDSYSLSITDVQEKTNLNVKIGAGAHWAESARIRNIMIVGN